MLKVGAALPMLTHLCRCAWHRMVKARGVSECRPTVLIPVWWRDLNCAARFAYMSVYVSECSSSDISKAGTAQDTSQTRVGPSNVCFLGVILEASLLIEQQKETR